MLLWLAACTCPSFDEMVVTDPEGLADEAYLDGIRAGIADFQAWTDREGVCAPEVRVVEDVAPESEALTGLYRGPRRPILVEPGLAEPGRVTAHELCHALDEREGHAEANPTLFPADEVPESPDYPAVALRQAESFANACERGPNDDTHGTAADRLKDLCGGTLANRQAVYLHEQVFTGEPWAGVSSEPVAITARTRALPLGDSGLLAAAPGDDGTLLLFTTDGATFTVLQLDPDTGAVRASLAPAEVADTLVTGTLTASAAIFTTRDGDEIGTLFVDFDLDTGRVGEHPLAVPDLAPVSVLETDGQIWVLVFDVAASALVLRAWDAATFAEAPPSATPPHFGLLLAGEEGIDSVGNSTLGHDDAATDRWTEQEIPSGFAGWRSGDRLLYLLSTGDGFAPAAYEPGAETLRFNEDPCAIVEDRASGLPVTLGARHFFFPTAAASPDRFGELLGGCALSPRMSRGAGGTRSTG